MASLFRKFREYFFRESKLLQKVPRQLQFEADINRLFLSTSYNRLGRDADDADIEEIIDMAEKAAFADQQVQVQENVHSQIKAIRGYMDEILLPDDKRVNESSESGEAKTSQSSDTTEQAELVDREKRVAAQSNVNSGGEERKDARPKRQKHKPRWQEEFVMTNENSRRAT